MAQCSINHNLLTVPISKRTRIVPIDDRQAYLHTRLAESDMQYTTHLKRLHVAIAPLLETVPPAHAPKTQA